MFHNKKNLNTAYQKGGVILIVMSSSNNLKNSTGKVLAKCQLTHAEFV